MEQLTREQAIEFSESGKWKSLSMEQRAKFQFSQDLLCMPFIKFHEALEKTIGRPVFTHELGMNKEGIKEELFNGAEPPSIDEILNLIPNGKLAAVIVTG